MGNISLKQWIVAGALSGVVIGILVFIILSLLLMSSPYPLEGPLALYENSFGFILTLFSYLFLGVITGIVLFFMYDRLPLKGRSPKCLLICSITVVIVGIFLFLLFYIEIVGEVFFIVLIPLFSPIYLSHTLIGKFFLGSYFYSLDFLARPLKFLITILFFALIPSLLIGIAFGFIINYFITKMERKAS